MNKQRGLKIKQTVFHERTEETVGEVKKERMKQKKKKSSNIQKRQKE